MNNTATITRSICALLIALVVCMLIQPASAAVEDKTGVTQGDVHWIKRLSAGQDNRVVVDGEGHVYVIASMAEEDNPAARDWLIRSFSSNGKLRWQKRMGGKVDDAVVDAVVDAKGHLYVLGTTMGSFAGASHAGKTDIVITKFSTTGEVKWVEQYGSPQDEYAKGITIDRSGSVYVVFDSKTLDNSQGISVVQFSRQGKRGWVRQFDSGLRDEAVDIVVGKRGLLYVLGSTEGNMWGHHNRGLTDVVVFKLNLEGEVIWIDQLGDKALDQPQRLVTDRFGNVRVLVTETRGELAAQGIGTADIKLYSLFAGDGRLNWMRRITAFGERGGIEGVDMASNDWGQTFLLAWTAAAYEGTQALGNMDNMILHFTADGDQIWVKRLGGKGADRPQSIAVAKDQRSLFVTGSTTHAYQGYPTSSGQPVSILVHLK